VLEDEVGQDVLADDARGRGEGCLGRLWICAYECIDS